jgi:hypothetical protein
MCLASTRALLVIAILLPQLLAQLGIRLVHRGLAQLARYDVIVAAVRNVGWNGVRAAAACSAPADSAAAALLTSAPLTLTLALTLTLTLTLSLSCLTARSSLAASPLTLAFAVGAAFAAFTPGAARTALTVCACAFLAQTAGAAASTALTRDHGLFLPHSPVENAKRFVELTIDLRRAFTARHGSAAPAAARLTAARGSSRASGLPAGLPAG